MEKIFTNIPIMTEEYVGYGNADALSSMTTDALKREHARVLKEIDSATNEYKAAVADGQNGYVEKERIKDALWYKKEVERYLSFATESVMEEKTFEDILNQYDELEKQYRRQYTDKDKLKKALAALDRGRENIANSKKEAKEKYGVDTFDEYGKIKAHEKYLHANNLTEKQFKRQEWKKNLYSNMSSKVSEVARKTGDKAKGAVSSIKSSLRPEVRKSVN